MDNIATTTYHMIQKPMIVPKSFPNIFSSKLTSIGLVSPDGGGAHVSSVPVGAALQSDNSVHNCLTSLLTAVKSINIKRLLITPWLIRCHCNHVDILFTLLPVWIVMDGQNYNNHYMT